MTYIKTNSLGAPKKPTYVFDSAWFTNIEYEIEDGKLKAKGPSGANATLHIDSRTFPFNFAGSIYDDNVKVQFYIDKYYLAEEGGDTWDNAVFDYEFKIIDILSVRLVLSNKVITCSVIKNGTTINIGTLPMESENTSILVTYDAFNMRNSGTILVEVHAAGGETSSREYIQDYDEALASYKVIAPGFTDAIMTGSSNKFWPIFDGSLTKVKIKDARQASGYLEATLLKTV